MQVTKASQPNVLMQLMPLILIGFVFYLLIYRPQNKRMKEHKAMLTAVARGDTIVTNGGLIGKVIKVADSELTVDLGGGVKVKVVQTMIADVRDKNVPANDTTK
jgi:preprotein translocase subunit YajC